MRSPNSGDTPGGDSAARGGASGRGEFAAIGRIMRRLPAPPIGEVWIGDDAAVVGSDAGHILLTTDMSVAGVHADLDLVGLDDLGWRAVAAAVSDIAAMGGRARHVLVAVAGPPSTDLDLLYDGVAGASEAHACAVVGGDLSNAREVVLAVTVTGWVGEGPGPVLRSGARRGDHLFVTGAVGGAAAGLRLLRVRAAHGDLSGPRDHVAPAPTVALERAFRRPRARLAEGEAARRAGASAMIDVSDGLAADLGHLAQASSVGVRLSRVPVADGATLEEALGGGEDYELLFAAPDVDTVAEVFAAAGLASPLVIGECTSDPTERSLGGRPLPFVGWEHAWT